MKLDPEAYEPKRRRLGLKHFLILMSACIIAPIAAAGWTDLYRNFLEGNPPQIVALEPPRGLGLFPVTIRFRVSDPDAGLDEVVVRIRQKSQSRELKKVSLKGKKSEEISVELDAENSKLVEGSANLELRAFDRSFWSNVAEASLQIKVDYRKPRVEVLSTQHNARVGGAQLVFYKAFDEDLAVSGIKVGNRTFLGFPATGIDKDLNESSLFAAVYAIALEQDPRELPVKVFAEDKVGNAVSETFYNKVSGRTQKEVTVAVDEQFLREKVHALADVYRGRFQGSEKQADPPGASGSNERLLHDFKTVNEKLRALNEGEIVSVINKNLRTEAYWTQPFFRQLTSVQAAYSDLVNYKYDATLLGSTVSRGEDLGMGRDQRDVLATNGGIIILAEEVGVYGWTVAIDHGLGVVSLYSHLEKPTVQEGEEVTRGQPIGIVGTSGFVRRPTLHFEIRVQGVAVDPREWWEAGWFQAHITGKINDLKRSLGIPIYTPLK